LVIPSEAEAATQPTKIDEARLSIPLPYLKVFGRESEPDWRFSATARDDEVVRLTPEKNENAGENRDDSSNNANGESKDGNQAVKNQKNRQQKHSNIFCKGHERSMGHGAWSVEPETSRSGCFLAAD
jgi:hypothetical protein